MPTWLVRMPLLRGELQVIMPELQPDGLALSLVWPRRKQWLPKVDALLNVLSELEIAGPLS